MLRIAYFRGKDRLKGELEVFRQGHKEWREEYTLYMAIKEKMGNKSWV